MHAFVFFFKKNSRSRTNTATAEVARELCGWDSDRWLHRLIPPCPTVQAEEPAVVVALMPNRLPACQLAGLRSSRKACRSDRAADAYSDPFLNSEHQIIAVPGDVIRKTLLQFCWRPCLVNPQTKKNTVDVVDMNQGFLLWAVSLCSNSSRGAFSMLNLAGTQPNNFSWEVIFYWFCEVILWNKLRDWDLKKVVSSEFVECFSILVLKIYAQKLKRITFSHTTSMKN